MTSSSATSPLLEKIRRLGKCPPSLLRWNAMNSFDDKVMGMLEMDGKSKSFVWYALLRIVQTHFVLYCAQELCYGVRRSRLFRLIELDRMPCL